MGIAGAETTALQYRVCPSENPEWGGLSAHQIKRSSDAEGRGRGLRADVRNERRPKQHASRK